MSDIMDDLDNDDKYDTNKAFSKKRVRIRGMSYVLNQHRNSFLDDYLNRHKNNNLLDRDNKSSVSDNEILWDPYDNKEKRKKIARLSIFFVLIFVIIGVPIAIITLLVIRQNNNEQD